MGRRPNQSKQNNSGFTLVEVLIAVIILAAVSGLFLRAFVSGANTNAKSKIRLKSTNAAENIMEDVKSLSIDEIVEKYGDSAVTYPNMPNPLTGENEIYAFDVTDKEELPKGYIMELTLDPSQYPAHNSINMSSFSTVDRDTAAVYSMPANFDDSVYEMYEMANKSMFDTGNSTVDWVAKTKDSTNDVPSFEERLRREIKITIEKDGSFKVDDEDVDQVKVKLSVMYCLDDEDIVPESYSKCREVTSRTLFDNSVSKKPLNSIFIMYNPRFDAAAKGGDVIHIYNPDSVEANLYVVAQNTESSKWANYLTESKGCLNLAIFEGTKSDVDDTDGYESPLHLKTNLCEEPDYSYEKQAGVDYECKKLLCKVRYAKASDSVDIQAQKKYKEGKFSPKLISTLDAANVAGKRLDASAPEDMIYEVKVTVSSAEEKNIERTAEDGSGNVETVSMREVIVSLKGSKLEDSGK